MNIHQKLIITAASAIIVGLAGLTPFAASWLQAKQAVSSAQVMPAAIEQEAAQPLNPAAIAGKPIRLQVEAIDIAIIEGIYNAQTGAWTLTDDKAQFALPTALPNDQSGNTLIYGHNTPRVFADLHALAPGAQARIYTDNDHIFTYAYRSSETVSPTTTDIFAYTGSPRLTLQTCTGFWSEHRKFFYFELVAVK